MTVRAYFSRVSRVPFLLFPPSFPLFVPSLRRKRHFPVEYRKQQQLLLAVVDVVVVVVVVMVEDKEGRGGTLDITFSLSTLGVPLPPHLPSPPPPFCPVLPR